MLTDIRACPDKASLMTSLYDEADTAERRAIEAHLKVCTACAEELDALKSVRRSLADWQVPVGSPGVRFVAEPARQTRRLWVALPLAAAATLVLGLAASLANLELRYDANGVTVRTGRGVTASADVAPVRESSATTGGRALPSGGVEQASHTSRPWASDLAALRADLRRELDVRARGVTAANGTRLSDEQILRRVQTLIDQSQLENRQEVAQRIAELVEAVQVQRRTDLVRLSNQLGRLESQRGVDQRLLNQLVQGVSLQQQP
jgi:polyhydroxyalkanoate synthesis regulator phasin